MTVPLPLSCNVPPPNTSTSSVAPLLIEMPWPSLAKPVFLILPCASNAPAWRLKTPLLVTNRAPVVVNAEFPRTFIVPSLVSALVGPSKELMPEKLQTPPASLSNVASIETIPMIVPLLLAVRVPPVSDIANAPAEWLAALSSIVPVLVSVAVPPPSADPDDRIVGVAKALNNAVVDDGRRGRVGCVGTDPG